MALSDATLPDSMAADANVFTIALAARMLGETEDRLWEIADQMEPEDGVVWIHDADERQTMAFTSFGMETLKELIADQPTLENEDPAALPG